MNQRRSRLSRKTRSIATSFASFAPQTGEARAVLAHPRTTHPRPPALPFIPAPRVIRCCRHQVQNSRCLVPGSAKKKPHRFVRWEDVHAGGRWASSVIRDPAHRHAGRALPHPPIRAPQNPPINSAKKKPPNQNAGSPRTPLGSMLTGETSCTHRAR